MSDKLKFMAAPAQTDIRWDLDVFFSSVEDPKYLESVADLPTQISSFDARLSKLSANPNAVTASELSEFINTLNDFLEQYRLVYSFTSLKVSTDSNDQTSQKALSSLNPISTQYSKFARKFEAFIGTLNPELWSAAGSPLADYAFPLNRTSESSKYLMAPELEALAADLGETGLSAWERLVDDFSSNISVPFNGEQLPMSRIRGMAYDVNQANRAAAYEAELTGWKANEIPLAAAMNSIKGEANTLAAARNWPEQLDETLFNSNMDRASLEAMLEAAKDSFPDWRRYLKAKGKLLGFNNGLPFHELFAQVGESSAWTWEEAEAFVEDGFRAYSDKLGDFAKQSFKERWHDVYPRTGKRDGAFCAGVTPGVSRMMHNFKESFGGASTLAHELGHAYHNLCLKDRKPMQKSTPMTLAETASIFCETIIKRRALRDATGTEKLSILDATLQGACQTTVDISSRYIFESEVIARRKERALTPEEFCDIMHRAQLATYGDGLDPDKMHPYMWAAKPHYYSDRAFYNFPYMFGLLFALGLYRVYEQEPNGFHERYDNLLSRTGLAMANDLTQEFGIDITDKAFWKGSLDVLVVDINEFCDLAEND